MRISRKYKIHKQKREEIENQHRLHSNHIYIEESSRRKNWYLQFFDYEIEQDPRLHAISIPIDVNGMKPGNDIKKQKKKLQTNRKFTPHKCLKQSETAKFEQEFSTRLPNDRKS